jgi:DnaJ-class molecular chaperone
VLVSENCTACKGTGTLERKESRSTCGDCDGSGRRISEMPVSEVYELARRRAERLVAPPPSAAREEALRVTRAEATSEDSPHGEEVGT